jgi:hypothetical protein
METSPPILWALITTKQATSETYLIMDNKERKSKAQTQISLRYTLLKVVQNVRTI